MNLRRATLCVIFAALVFGGSLAPHGLAPVGLPAPQPAAAAGLTVTKVSLTTPIKRGRPATIRVKTAAGARCSIVVTYKTGPSSAKGLNAKTAPSTGRLAWTWTVGSNTTPGSWPIKVSCKLGSKTGTLRVTFKVTS
jgi:hypothetical protein